VEDGPRGIDPEEDVGADEVGELDDAEQGVAPDYGIDQTECLPAAMVLESDREAMMPHRDRIRATRCDRLAFAGVHREYRLRDAYDVRHPYAGRARA
jgi:hypothetical protein